MRVARRPKQGQFAKEIASRPRAQSTFAPLTWAKPIVPRGAAAPGPAAGASKPRFNDQRPAKLREPGADIPRRANGQIDLPTVRRRVEDAGKKGKP